MSFRPSPLVLRQGRLVERTARERQAEPAAVGDALVVVPPKLSSRRRWVLLLVVLFTLVPVSLHLMSLRLTPMVLMLIAMLGPMTAMWLRRSHGPVVVPDLLILGYSVWSVIALIANQGFAEGIQPAGISLISTFGAYLLGRMLVRDSVAWFRLSTLLYATLLVITPFLVFESLTGMKPLIKAMSLFGGGVPPVEMNKRMGLSRAQGSFEHPILMGIFMGSLLSITAYSMSALGKRSRHAVAIGLSTIGVFCSLSTGPLLSVNVQFFLMLYGRIFRFVKNRWKILLIAVVVAYFVLDTMTTRSPFHTFVRYATFSSQSSYNRILIWQYGSASVWNHPWFGIGLGEWERPRYMSGSMDNFWLVQAVRYGLPAFLCYAGAFLVVIVRLARADLPDEKLDLVRRGMIFCFIGTIIATVSVHLWNATYIWLNFLLGSSVWLMATPQSDQASLAAAGQRAGAAGGRRSTTRRAP